MVEFFTMWILITWPPWDVQETYWVPKCAWTKCIYKTPTLWCYEQENKKQNVHMPIAEPKNPWAHPGFKTAFILWDELMAKSVYKALSSKGSYTT